MSTDLLHIMEENSSRIAVRYGEDTFPDLFWKQQLATSSKTEEWQKYAVASIYD